VGIPLGTNCSPLLTDLLLYSYEADFIQGLLKKTKRSYPDLYFTFHYTDDILSVNNSKAM
jgi:hypothetical protein